MKTLTKALASLLLVSLLFSCSKEMKKEKHKSEFDTYVAKEFSNENNLEISGQPFSSFSDLWIIFFKDDSTTKYKLQGKKDGQVLTQVGTYSYNQSSVQLNNQDGTSYLKASFSSDKSNLKVQADENRSSDLVFYLKKSKDCKKKK
jgi:uncharacterized lipoprotein